MNKPILNTIFLTLFCTGTWASEPSGLQILFAEGAPKDKFTATNYSTCTFTNVELTIDLTGSLGGLIFDTTSSGAGGEVFQPFESVDGKAKLVGDGQVLDGDQRLSLRLDALAPGESFAFTIDIDDTLTRSELGQIRVSNNEFTGSAVLFRANEVGTQQGVFNNKSGPKLILKPCIG